MTIEIRELLIKTKVTKDPALKGKEIVENKFLLSYLQKMQEEITKDCIKTVLSTIKSSR